MKKTINFYEFERAFIGRREDKFTYEGKKALFQYLEEYEEETGTEIELDVVALCGEFSEFKSLEEFQNQYSKDKYQYQSFEDIEFNTLVIPVTLEYSSSKEECFIKSFIIQNF